MRRTVKQVSLNHRIMKTEIRLGFFVSKRTELQSYYKNDTIYTMYTWKTYLPPPEPEH